MGESTIVYKQWGNIPWRNANRDSLNCSRPGRCPIRGGCDGALAGDSAGAYATTSDGSVFAIQHERFDFRGEYCTRNRRELLEFGLHGLNADNDEHAYGV